MPTQLLPLGMPVTMEAGVAYALPVVECTIYTDAAATLTQSNTQAFTASNSVTLTAGSAVLSGGFLKATLATLVTLKRD